MSGERDDSIRYEPQPTGPLNVVRGRPALERRLEQIVGNADIAVGLSEQRGIVLVKIDDDAFGLSHEEATSMADDLEEGGTDHSGTHNLIMALRACADELGRPLQ